MLLSQAMLLAAHVNADDDNVQSRGHQAADCEVSMLLQRLMQPSASACCMQDHDGRLLAASLLLR